MDDGFWTSYIRMYEDVVEELFIMDGDADIFYNIGDVFIMKPNRQI